VGNLVLQGVRPRGCGDGHAGVVVEAVSSQRPEHGVSADGQEGGAHALDVLGVDAGVADEHLCLANHLVGPLLLAELGAVTVSDCVGGDLVTVGVQVLDLRVVRPLVRNVVCRFDRTTVGVEPVFVEFFEEIFVETVDGVVKGEEDKLGHVVQAEVSRIFRSAAEAIR